jgi:mannose-1-phosphate guanylyltransferase
MAGGSGERFWPLSRRDRPKQLLRLTQPDATMLHEAVERIAPVIPAEHIYIVTGTHLVDPIREAQVGVPDANVIAEPHKRNTSGAMAYAVAHLLARYDAPPEGISMAVLTADHTIGEPEMFCATVESALRVAEAEPVLATIGMVPTRSETGYGYIQLAERAEPMPESSEGYPVLPVAAFHEKPNKETAESFVASGDFLWNGGMFFWRLSTFLDELDQARPQLAESTRALAEAMQAGDEAKVDVLFAALDDISIDYALMEHARRVVVARAEFPWDDIGAWPALDRALDHDDAGNVTMGDPVVVDTRNSIVYNAPGAEGMAVGVVGVDDLVVVVTEDAVLVLPKDRAQDVREVVKALKERGDGRM